MRLLFQKLVACENKSQRRYNISCNCLFLLAHSLLDLYIGLQVVLWCNIPIFFPEHMSVFHKVCQDVQTLSYAILKCRRDYPCLDFPKAKPQNLYHGKWIKLAYSSCKIYICTGLFLGLDFPVPVFPTFNLWNITHLWMDFLDPLQKAWSFRMDVKHTKPFSYIKRQVIFIYLFMYSFDYDSIFMACFTNILIVKTFLRDSYNSDTNTCLYVERCFTKQLLFVQKERLVYFFSINTTCCHLVQIHLLWNLLFCFCSSLFESSFYAESLVLSFIIRGQR